MNTTRTAKNSKNSGLLKNAMNSKLAKKTKSKFGVNKLKAESEKLIERVSDAPIAVQLGALAVVAASSYVLYKNREKIQEFIKETGSTVSKTVSKVARSGDDMDMGTH